MMPPRWTDAEKLAVFSAVGTQGWSALQRRAGGRSIEAVRRQIRRLWGSGARRGSISLRSLSESTGYNRAQLRRAKKALSQCWQRMSSNGPYLITEDQAEDLVAWLAHDFWSSKNRLYCCSWCSTSARPHRARGLCNRCFCRYRRKCLENGIPLPLSEQKDIIGRINLDCNNLMVHAKCLEEAKSLLNEGLALSERLLDWLVVVYEREDGSGVDS